MATHVVCDRCGKSEPFVKSPSGPVIRRSVLCVSDTGGASIETSAARDLCPACRDDVLRTLNAVLPRSAT